jgi:hypothetical protein
MNPDRRISRVRRALEEPTRDGKRNILVDSEGLITHVQDNEWEQYYVCVLQHIATTMKLRLPNIDSDNDRRQRLTVILNEETPSKDIIMFSTYHDGSICTHLYHHSTIVSFRFVFLVSTSPIIQTYM